MDWVVVVGLMIRAVMVVLAFAAMWSLWVAKRERGHLWTGKMYDIWFCHMCFVTGAACGNVQFFYQRTFPSIAIPIVFVALVWTIKGTFRGEMYVRDDPKAQSL